jgi:hypothetical protein
MSNYYRSVVVSLQVLIVSLLIPFGNSVAQGVQLLRDGNVDTPEEVFVINNNFLSLDRNKLDQSGTLPASKLTVSSLTVSGPLYLVGFTTGSVLFIGDNQQVAENQGGLYWNNEVGTLHINSSTTYENEIFVVHTATRSADLVLASWSDQSQGHSGEVTSIRSRTSVIGQYEETLDGDQLFELQAYGTDASNTLSELSFHLLVDQDGDATASRVPSRMEIWTSSGVNAVQAGPVQAFAITPEQKVIIGTNTVARGHLHVYRSDTGVAPSDDADDIVIEDNLTRSGLSILSALSGRGNIFFGSSADSVAGQMAYDHNTRKLLLATVNIGVLVSSNGFVTIRPVGLTEWPDAELEVSDGSTQGGGDVHAAAFLSHSSEKIKSDIRRLDQSEYVMAYTNAKDLKQYEYRYKVLESTTTGRLIRDVNQPLRRGPIYEQSPTALRGEHETISLNDRILQLEMALKIAIQKIELLERR